MATQPKKKNTVLRAEGEITQQRLLLLVHDIKCRRIFIEKLEVPRDAHLWEESSIRNADCFQCLLDVAHIRLDVTFLFFTWKLRGCSALLWTLAITEEPLTQEPQLVPSLGPPWVTVILLVFVSLI